MYLKSCLVFVCFVNTGLILCSKSEEIDNLIKGEQNVIDKGEGLIVKIIKEKKNCQKVAEIGDHLDVHYVGRLDDENGKIFDESRPKGYVFKFQLGAGQVCVIEKDNRFSYRINYLLLREHITCID